MLQWVSLQPVSDLSCRTYYLSTSDMICAGERNQLQESKILKYFQLGLREFRVVMETAVDLSSVELLEVTQATL